MMILFHNVNKGLFMELNMYNSAKKILKSLISKEKKLQDHKWNLKISWCKCKRRLKILLMSHKQEFHYQITLIFVTRCKA